MVEKASVKNEEPDVAHNESVELRSTTSNKAFGKKSSKGNKLD